MRLLVTGGAGFIGSNFILYWIRKYSDDVIINLDRLTYAGNPDNLKEIEGNPNYHFVKGDICNPLVVNKVMQDIDIVVHFAAESHVDRSIKNPADFIMTNVVGTQVLLDSAAKNRIKKFHHVSTDEVFGSLDLSSKSKFNERTQYNPRSPYSASKAGSDHLIRAYLYTYNLPMTITNCSNNFGPYQYPEKFIPLAVTNLLEGKKVPIYGDGFYVRDWLYVEDHCHAIDLVIRSGRIGETYLVGGMTKDVTNLEVVRKILRFMGKDDGYIEFVKDRPGHDRKYSVDWSKIKEELGWKPSNDFDTWLKYTIDWYRKNEWWWRKLKGEEFRKYYRDWYGDEA